MSVSDQLPLVRKLPSSRVFFLGTGACGTKYVKRLLRENGVDRVGCSSSIPASTAVDYFHGARHADTMKPLVDAAVGNTRVISDDTFSLLTPLLVDAYPDATFVHLHRPGQHCIRTKLSGHGLTVRTAWDTTREQVWPDLGDPAPWFVKYCNWWQDVNAYILKILRSTGPFLSLSAPMVWTGDRVDVLEALFDTEFDTPSLPPRDTRDTYTFPKFSHWPLPYKYTFGHMCGDMMTKLGYTTGPDSLENRRRDTDE